MVAVWHDLECIGQKTEVKGTHRFWFKIKSETPVPYQSGQFLTFDFPTGEKRAQRWRSYSIANTYDGSNIIELGVSYKKGGLASQYLFEEMNKGDIIKCKGPEGTFVLPVANPSASLVFIAAGAGVVPFRCMLQEIESKKMKFKNIHLIYGTRTEKTILYKEEIEDWCHFVENFSCDISLSKEDKLPKNSPNLFYNKGYVHPVYLEKYKKNPANHIFMICGWTAMIDDTVAHLYNDLKVPREQIKYELFG